MWIAGGYALGLLGAQGPAPRRSLSSRRAPKKGAAAKSNAINGCLVMGDFLLNGLIVGSIITLGAVGLTFIAAILNLFNLAHGSMFTLGAYFTLFFLGLIPDWGTFPSLSFGLSLVFALVLSMVATASVVLIFDRTLIQPLRKRGSSSLFLAFSTLGVALILRASINMLWGPGVQYYSLTIQKAMRLPIGVSITPDEVFILIVTLALVIFLQFFLKYSKIGKAMRAMADNEGLARVTGINTERVIMWTWVIAASLVTIAGTLYGIKVQVRPLIGWNLLIPLFAAMILGGVGSFHGALVGGLIIGIAQELITGLLQDAVINLNLPILMTAYKQTVAFIILIAVLLIRPTGIWGIREVR